MDIYLLRQNNLTGITETDPFEMGSNLVIGKRLTLIMRVMESKILTLYNTRLKINNRTILQ